jgi:galactose mutarotase-like enzyme
MPFSIGNHITFKAPLINGPGEQELMFFSSQPDQLIRADDGTFSGEVTESAFSGWRPVASLPQRKAVSVGGGDLPAELIVADPSGLQIRLRHRASSEPTEPFIQFNLWADQDEGFFSPEPWLGTQNSLNSGVGLVWLEPGANWQWNIEITPTWTKRMN